MIYTIFVFFIYLPVALFINYDLGDYLYVIVRVPTLVYELYSVSILCILLSYAYLIWRTGMKMASFYLNNTSHKPIIITVIIHLYFAFGFYNWFVTTSGKIYFGEIISSWVILVLLMPFLLFSSSYLSYEIIFQRSSKTPEVSGVILKSLSNFYIFVSLYIFVLYLILMPMRMM